jgi:hypothetical protein
VNRSANAPCEVVICLLHIPTYSYHPVDPKHSQFQVSVSIIVCDLIVFRIVLGRKARYLCNKGMDQTRDFGGYLRMSGSMVGVSACWSLREP